MTRTEVHQARQEIDRQAEALRAEMVVIGMKRNILRQQCGHPDIQPYYPLDGMKTRLCEDCGFSE